MIGQVNVRTDTFGRGTLLLDGADVADAVREVQLHVVPGQATRLTLTLAPARWATYDGPADVHVVERQDVRAWLDGLDPADLDRALLSRPQTVKPGVAILDWLAAHAGDTAGAAHQDHEDVPMPDGSNR